MSGQMSANLSFAPCLVTVLSLAQAQSLSKSTVIPNTLNYKKNFSSLSVLYFSRGLCDNSDCVDGEDPDILKTSGFSLAKTFCQSDLQRILMQKQRLRAQGYVAGDNFFVRRRCKGKTIPYFSF